LAGEAFQGLCVPLHRKYPEKVGLITVEYHFRRRAMKSVGLGSNEKKRGGRALVRHVKINKETGRYPLREVTLCGGQPEEGKKVRLLEFFNNKKKD